MRVVAIASPQGGMGKTTTAVNLAAALAELGDPVLVIDLDVQASCSRWFGVHDDGHGLLDVLSGQGAIEPLIQETAVPGVSLVPSGPWMMAAERVLTSEVGGELILRSALDQLPRFRKGSRPSASIQRRRFAWILLDCPPTLGAPSLAGLVAARELLVPVAAHVLSLPSVVALEETVTRVRDRLNPALPITGILACRVARTRLRDIVKSCV